MNDDIGTPKDGLERVPALRPQLPSAERLLPYLRRIDSSRVYTNWGPLVGELELRIADQLRLPSGGVTSAGSGTAALVGAILATVGRANAKRPFALLPAFTFIATAVAAEQCGYRPYLADVDADTWMLDPERLVDHPILTRVGVIVPVAPFGRPVPQAPWRAFHARTGIPVIIDGAASFDRIALTPEHFLGQTPVAMSFHATKCFATGEGGAVVSTDVELTQKVTQALNYGFYGDHDSRAASTNGKMSEYHAAIGLAELDLFPEKLQKLCVVARRYKERLDMAKLPDRIVSFPDIGASYVLFRCADPSHAETVIAAFAREAVECRRWYGTGIHRHPHFAAAARDDLPVTDDLAPRLIALPLAPDLSATDTERVADVVISTSKTLPVS